MLKSLLGCLADRVKPTEDEGYMPGREALAINARISQKYSKTDPAIDEFNFHSISKRGLFNRY